MKLQTKIFIFLLPLIVIPISLIGWIAYKRLQFVSQENLKNQMIASITSTQEIIFHKIKSMEDNIVLYSQAKQIENYIFTKNEDQRHSDQLSFLLKLFESYQKIFNDCIEMRILTQDGYEEARLVSIRMKNIKRDEADTPFFQELKKSQSDTYTNFYHNPDINNFNMFVSQKVQFVESAGAINLADDQHTFYLSVTCSLEYIEEVVNKNKFGKNGHIFFTNKNGKILFHSYENMVDTFIARNEFEELKNLVDNPIDITTVKLTNVSYSSIGVSITPNLYLFATIPTQEYESAGRSHWAMIVTGTMLLSLIIIFGTILIIIKLFILTPIVKLNQSIKKVGTGDLNSKIILNRRDEIGILSNRFNNMVEKLQTITYSHDYVDSIIESITDSIFVVDSNGIIKKANKNACKITGYSADQLTIKSILDFFPNDDDFLAKTIRDGARVSNIEKTMVINKAEQYPILLSTSLLVHSKDSKDIICVVHDISDRVKAEQEKIKAHKIAADQSKHALIGRVAGKMAHDFNNVLSIIMGNSELALDDCNDKNIKKTLELIFNQTIRGKNLTKNLVAFAKSQAPKQENFNIADKIEFVTNLLRKDLFKIELTVNNKREHTHIFADPGMIEHSLVNLIQNAIHATSRIDQPKIAIHSYNDQKNVYIEIIDNGCGIPNEYLDSIYEPSFTLKGSNDNTSSYKTGIKGTGYGLANVKKYISQHNGTISVEANIDAGSKFTICLPISKVDIGNNNKISQTPIKEPMHIRKPILVVEDETFISDVQYRILTQTPYFHHVDIAPSGETALKLLKTKNYKLISLDYILSGEMNGMDVYNHIRKINKKVPILFNSGNLEFLESIKQLKHSDNNVDHLPKPCKNKDYLNAIDVMLNKTE